MSDRFRACYRSAALVWCLVGASHAVIARDESGLLDARTVLSDIAHSAPTQGQLSQPPARVLLGDIRKFRTTAPTLTPEVAANTWIELYDRTFALAAAPRAGAVEFDPDVRAPLGVNSVMAALPPPSAWPALLAAAKKRAAGSDADVRSQTLVLLAEVLVGDRQATDAQVRAIEATIRNLDPETRVGLRDQLAEIRHTLVKLYGSSAEIASQFEEDLRKALEASSSDTNWHLTLDVPDLVTLVGIKEAERLLAVALTVQTPLSIESGDATRQMARRLALQKMGTLKTPQWRLIDSVDAAPLYEAMRTRFPDTAATRESEQPDEDEPGYSPRATTDAYYLLALIVAGRNEDARALVKAAFSRRQLELPQSALHALQNSGQNEALYSFLQGELTHNPNFRAWAIYIQQAAFVGRSREAVKVLENALARPNLPGYLRKILQRERAEALLAVDDTGAALKAYDEILRAPPMATELFLSDRVEVALRVAALGRVLQKQAAAAAGLQFVRKALELPATDQSSLDRKSVLSEWFAEARKQHQEGQAQRVAIAELKRAQSVDESRNMMGIPVAQPERLVALIELVSLYSAENRPADVRQLLDESTDWGSRDLANILMEKDSQGIPVSLLAARALSTDQQEQAVRLAKATIAAYPGYDAAYELESAFDPHAQEVLAAQFKQDQFEERPLIWTAVILERNNQRDAAEKTVRAAIAIDPSDGEEGVNDRMRAYAVLADILEAKGDAKGAADYRSAVAAIRISEHSDELYHLGLYQRAFAGYREALGRFSNAYCIQSRLAVQLDNMGQHEEAAQHYRRAYELMPESFGRVESHCFGCESVFRGSQPQSIATQVFDSLARRNPRNPQVHYLQGYLLQEQGRYPDAAAAYRKAVEIDDNYLNAWKQLNGLSAHIHLDTADRNIVTLKLLELDPEQRHVQYEFGAVGDLASLWYAVGRIYDSHPVASPEVSLYPLRSSAAIYDSKQSEMPAEIREQLHRYEGLVFEAQQRRALMSPPVALGTHALLGEIGVLLGAHRGFDNQ
jgi:tetratricopeptide (TPR) repeat protein